MAKVTKSSGAYEFVGLNEVGMQLVNEFQRYHPELCMPSSDPSYRFIRQGSMEQNLELEKLVADVRPRDPEPAPPHSERGDEYLFIGVPSLRWYVDNSLNVVAYKIGNVHCGDYGKVTGQVSVPSVFALHQR